ncbi:MAG: hypothetical protein ACRDNN_15300 [Gaiellaceae bacterium]
MWIVLTVAIGLAAAVVGRWWMLLLPVLVWPIYFLGLAQEWWGSGLGDGWQFGLAIVVAISLAAAALGVGLRSLLAPRARRPASA